MTRTHRGYSLTPCTALEAARPQGEEEMTLENRPATEASCATEQLARRVDQIRERFYCARETFKEHLNRLCGVEPPLPTAELGKDAAPARDGTIGEIEIACNSLQTELDCLESLAARFNEMRP